MAGRVSGEKVEKGIRTGKERVRKLLNAHATQSGGKRKFQAQVQSHNR